METEVSELQIVKWGQGILGYDRGKLFTVSADVSRFIGDYPAEMAHSNAHGRGLVSNGALGADLIRLEAGDGFTPHTHPGDHLLVIMAGNGTVTIGGKIHPTEAGDIYLVPGMEPHAVGAISEHVILAVGAPHMPVDSEDRMTPVEYTSVASDLPGVLECLLCAKVGTRDELIAQGCPHAPPLH
jgi:quercetin dioxygenase-like cupin family protein